VRSALCDISQKRVVIVGGGNPGNAIKRAYGVDNSEGWASEQRIKRAYGVDNSKG
jgi:hypothetical protein